MKLDNIVELLDCVPLFHGLSNEQLRRLAFEGEKVIIYPNQKIISKNAVGDSGYLIVSGTASIVEGLGVEDKPEKLEKGTFVGEMAMLIETEHGSTIIAETELKAIRFSYSHMQNIMKSDVTIAEHFAEHMRSKFMTFTNQLQNLEKQFFNDQENDLPIHQKGNIAFKNPHFVNASQSLQ